MPYRVDLNKFANLTNEEYCAMLLETRRDVKRRMVKALRAARKDISGWSLMSSTTLPGKESENGAYNTGQGRLEGVMGY
ncbi:hypothetical protein SAY87_018479 [Trapa incisa]|uniref:Uncharacterized protein n=2 Tax=Trapa TaxID=22665 RepID=A0AAN7LHU9_TRANT|nr:hypothetical protein SAY87_018479 [Trapa incisa]KAK4784574.1 hypothetical protein SAY86_018942 [Trapa natans]